MWKLKEHDFDNDLSREIHKQKALPYQCGLKRHNLCLSVKGSIICAGPGTLLNKGTELQSRTKYLEQNGKI